jgi:hypothetical protein
MTRYFTGFARLYLSANGRRSDYSLVLAMSILTFVLLSGRQGTELKREYGF